MRKYRLPAILAMITAALLLNVADSMAGDKITEAQDYEVMSLLIKDQYGSEFSMILISRDTEPWCLREQLSFLQRQWPMLKNETIDALIVNNSGETQQFDEKFRIPVKYRLVSDSEYLHALLGDKDSSGDKILDSGSDSAVSGAEAYAAISEAADPDWDNFDKVFPDAQGYLTFSRIGFDPEGTQALVIYSNAYRCSGARVSPRTRKIACFSKKNGTWELVGVSRSINATD
jgi:hypothetical protein